MKQQRTINDLMIDEPAPLDLATMERHLDYLKKLPDDILGKRSGGTRRRSR
jgi:hypothetical protein